MMMAVNLEAENKRLRKSNTQLHINGTRDGLLIDDLEDKARLLTAENERQHSQLMQAREDYSSLSAENSALKIEATCNHCGEYHGREVCESLLSENRELRRFLDEAKTYAESIVINSELIAENMPLSISEPSQPTANDSPPEHD